MRFKSIFTKQLVLYISILFFSFVLLAGVLGRVYSEYYISLKEKELMKQGKKITSEYANAFDMGIFNTDELTYELRVLEDYMDASIFFIDSDGTIIFASESINQMWIGQTITDRAKQGVLEGKIVTVQGRIGGMFLEPVLTVGYPIVTSSGVAGGIFMCMSMPEIEGTVKGVYKAGIVSMICTMAVGAVLIYFFSDRLSKPLLEMNKAAKVIANGNFEKRLKIDSQDEVGQLAESFNEMAESLSEHEQVRRDFIANVSHDLRSPLTSIQGFLAAILDGTIPKEKEERYLQIIYDETKRLSKLTNDIMDLSKAEGQNLTLNRVDFDINEMIRDCITKFEPIFSQKHIAVHLIFEEENITVNGDEEKILRVLQNLIDNALKFTEENGSVEVETTIKNKKVYVMVRDTGQGISPEDQRHVFDRFFKADSSRGKDKKGGGLGLCIAKEFMKAHNETISVKSKLGEGSEFTFTLPFVPSNKGRQSKKASEDNEKGHA